MARDDQAATATAPFATPAALLAMKLHAIQTRSTAGLDKRAADAWDIYRLLLDLDADGDIRADLALASAPLRRLVVDAADRVLIAGAARTAGWLRGGSDEMAAVRADELRALARPLLELV